MTYIYNIIVPVSSYCPNFMAPSQELHSMLVKFDTYSQAKARARARLIKIILHI